jgi:hypothetical protein
VEWFRVMAYIHISSSQCPEFFNCPVGAVPRGLACASSKVNVAGTKFITRTPRELRGPASLENLVVSKVCGTKWILGVVLGGVGPCNTDVRIDGGLLYLALAWVLVIMLP